MPGFLYHLGASAICPHGGQISVVTSNARVLVNGLPVATQSDFYPVAGCVFTIPGPKPQPCILARFLVPAARVLVNGQPALIQTSTGLCQSAEQIPQGPPTIVATQTRVVAT
jgi:uncharacterized Zn-binding protein involved in type VI secretion